MTKTILFTLFFAAVFSAPGSLSAASMESLAAGSDQSFSEAISVQQVKPYVPAMQSQLDAEAAAHAYQNLAAAFETGTAPEQKDLAGWHAGRILDKEMPELAGSILLASQEIRTIVENGFPAGNAYKLIPLIVYASPTFFETMNKDLVAGVKAFVKEEHPQWTIPQFSPTGISFERVMPVYDKGFSRFEVRKALDGRILIRHSWKSAIGSSVFDGTAYAFLTKDVTPQ